MLHGLAFATLLGRLQLDRAGLVTTLLGFNLGIEVAQLLVVAMVMPSLVLLSRTSAYSLVRVVVAALGAMLAAGWFGVRTGLLSENPLEAVGNVLTDHPVALAVGLAVFSLGLTGPRRAGGRAGRQRQQPAPGLVAR